MRVFLMYMVFICAVALLQVGSESVADAATGAVVQSEYRDFKLKVPYYKQSYPNSCEAASLKMALAFKGVLKNEVQILTQFTYKPTFKDYVNNIWDDPQKQFVGYVDIAGRPRGGYGVYGLPVLRAVKNFGLDGEYATGTALTASFFTKELDAKNPVVFWGYSSYVEAPYTWNTKEGTTVKAFKGEHVRVLVGYRGTAEKPLGFYVHDPFTGKSNEYWTTAKLMEQLGKVPGVTDQAVVIR